MTIFQPSTVANRLASARTISVTGNVVGSAKFDGSADISIDVQPKVAYPAQSGTVSDSYAWQRIATLALPIQHIGNDRYTIVLDVMPDVTTISGRLTATVSYNGNNKPTTTNAPSFKWDWRTSGVNTSQWILAYTTTADDTYSHQAEIWCYNKSYGSHHITQVDTYIRGSGTDYWDLKTKFSDIQRKSSWKDLRTATDTGATETIDGVEVTWKAVTSSDQSLATSTTGSATKATQDGAGNVITSTYQRKMTLGTTAPSSVVSGDVWYDTSE